MDTSVLKAVPLFKDLGDEDLIALGELMSETSLKRGDSLFREGDEGDRLYIITEWDRSTTTLLLPEEY